MSLARAEENTAMLTAATWPQLAMRNAQLGASCENICPKLNLLQVNDLVRKLELVFILVMKFNGMHFVLEFLILAN